MEITVNSKGNLELDIKDLLQNIDDEQAESLIQALAWDSRMWNVLKEAIKNEHGAFHYNEDLLKLRLAFLTEWDDDFDNPYTRVADVISALLTEINQQRNSAQAADVAFWKIYHQMSGIAKEHGIRLETPEHETMQFFHGPAKEIAEKYMPENAGKLPE
ncbi:MAG: hypothetical protein WC714_28770 [Candidatus Obscuribacterales bacterium]|jgi:hypothetical protein